MWLHLALIHLLLGTIVGYPEAGGSLSNGERTRNRDADMLGDRIGKSGSDASKRWKGTAFICERIDGEGTVPAAVVTGDPRRSEDLGNPVIGEAVEDARGMGPSVKIVGKRGKIVGSWRDLARNGKGVPQEKKDPSIYWWSDKRVKLYGPGEFGGIRRSIHEPFYSWGGKRASEYFASKPDSPAERIKSSDGRYVVCWTLPYYMAAGKRSQKSADPEEFLPATENAEETEASGRYGKRNVRFVHRTAGFHPINRATATENDYATERDDRWITPTAEKRSEYSDSKATESDPRDEKPIRRAILFQEPILLFVPPDVESRTGGQIRSL